MNLFGLNADQITAPNHSSEGVASAPSLNQSLLIGGIGFCFASLLVFGFFPRLLTDKIKPVTEQIVKMATVKPATPSAVVMVESK